MAACAPSGGLGFAASGLAGPPAADGSRRGESGLVVGDRLMDSGEYELALKAYLRAAAEEGTSAQVLTSIASANLALGRVGQAEQVLRQALKIDPEYVPALNNLGVVLMELDKPGEARVFFQRAYALDSGATDSIRENLRLAIARSEASVYAGATEVPSPQALPRTGQGGGSPVTLSDL